MPFSSRPRPFPRPPALPPPPPRAPPQKKYINCLRAGPFGAARPRCRARVQPLHRAARPLPCAPRHAVPRPLGPPAALVGQSVNPKRARVRRRRGRSGAAARPAEPQPVRRAGLAVGRQRWPQAARICSHVSVGGKVWTGTGSVWPTATASSRSNTCGHVVWTGKCGHPFQKPRPAVSGGYSIGALGPRWPAWQSMDVDNGGPIAKGPHPLLWRIGQRFIAQAGSCY
eukprot:359840-Chlamydomonas_euryale.AAC.1